MNGFSHSKERMMPEDLYTKLKTLLEQEISRTEYEIKELVKKRAELEGPKVSKSSHDLQDNEEEVYIKQLLLKDYQEKLQSIEAIKERSGGETAEEGAMVKLKFLTDQSTQDFILINGPGGKVGEFTLLSTKTPVGKATIGKKTGERVVIQTPGGEAEIEILSVI